MPELCLHFSRIAADCQTGQTAGMSEDMDRADPVLKFRWLPDARRFIDVLNFTESLAAADIED